MAANGHTGAGFGGTPYVVSYTVTTPESPNPDSGGSDPSYGTYVEYSTDFSATTYPGHNTGYGATGGQRIGQELRDAGAYSSADGAEIELFSADADTPYTPYGNTTTLMAEVDLSQRITDEISALNDGETWPVEHLDETTTLTEDSYGIRYAKPDLGARSSTIFPGCINGSLFWDTSAGGWGVVTFPRAANTGLWYDLWKERCSGSVAVWRTEFNNIYEDPDQGLTTGWTDYINGLSFGISAGMGTIGSDGSVTLVDSYETHPTVGYPFDSNTTYGTIRLTDPFDPVSWRESEKISLKETFGFSKLADGEPYQETFQRLNNSLDTILDGLEEGFVPRNDVIRTIPRLKMSNERYQKITQKETMEDVTISQILDSSIRAGSKRNGGRPVKYPGEGLLTAEEFRMMMEAGGDLGMDYGGSFPAAPMSSGYTFMGSEGAGAGLLPVDSAGGTGGTGLTPPSPGSGMGIPSSFGFGTGGGGGGGMGGGGGSY